MNLAQMPAFISYIGYALIILGTLVNSGCTRPHSVSPDSSTVRRNSICLVLILDETLSAVHLWPQSIKVAARSVGTLYPGDRLLILGLDDHAFDASDVLRNETLPLQSLLAAKKKGDLVAWLTKLSQRPTSSGYLINGKPRPDYKKGTDTIGTFDFAAKLVEGEPRALCVAIFSDMEKEQLVRTSQQHYLFPSNTHFCALGMSAHGHEDIESRINYWIGQLQSFGIIAGSQDFHLEALVKDPESVVRSVSIVKRPAHSADKGKLNTK